jgi:hypothetical protein
MFLAGFIQKTDKLDQIIKLNHVYSQCKQLQKLPENSRWQPPEAEGRRLPGPTCRPAGPLGPHVMLRFNIGSSTVS